MRASETSIKPMVWGVLGDPFWVTNLELEYSKSVPMQRGARFFLRRSVPMQRGARFWIFDVPWGGPTWPQ